MGKEPYRKERMNGFKNRGKRWTCQTCKDEYTYTGWGEPPTECMNCYNAKKQEEPDKDVDR